MFHPRSVRWLKRHRQFLLWILGASAIPPLVLLAFSYYQTVTAAQQALDAAVHQGARRIDSLLITADTTLGELATDLQRIQPDSPEALRLLQRVAYSDPRFREIGVIDEKGFLVITSLGVVDPPVLITSSIRADLDRKTLQIVGPVTTVVMQERSIILVLPTQGAGEINILVDPAILTHYWADVSQLDLGSEGFLVYVNRASGRILASDGVPPQGGYLGSEPAPRHRLRASQVSANGEVMVIAEVARSWILRNWLNALRIGGPLTAICSGILMVLSIRAMRMTQAFGHDIRAALENSEFEVHYQPMIHLETGQCVGAEALIRWRHPEQGLLLPGLFIPIAEKTGLITAIGNWVFEQVVRDQATLGERWSDIYITINVSAVQINSGSLDAIIYRLLEDKTLRPERFVFEITEALFIQDEKTAALDAIARLRGIGSRVALDDFGTGYSGLSYLHKFNLDYLKIDRLYVTAINTPSRINAVIDAIIELGRRLDLELIAEGVETAEQRRFLLERNIQYAQGWHIARPMPLKEFQQFLTKNLTPRVSSHLP